MRFGLAVTSIAVMGFIVPPSLARTHHGTTTKAQTKDIVSAKPVVLTAQPGTNLDQVARQLNAADLADAAKHNDNPVVLVASAPLSSDQSDMALFVQLQSARLCGSAGCSTSVYLRHKGGWKLVLDSVSGAISVLPTRHKNMHDLQIDKNDRWTWNGSSYEDSIAAPPPPATPHKKLAEKPKKKLLRG